jgi:dolichol-phosphate mannosyltransferase
MSDIALRVRQGIRRPAAWLQLARFAAVGGSGYVVNLAVYALLLPLTDYRLAATGAFGVAVTNNFVWNRRWTFRDHDGPRHHQAARFLTVSVVAVGFNLAVLTGLVDGLGVDELIAQAAAIVLATPLSFVGNKLWTFSRPGPL